MRNLNRLRAAAAVLPTRALSSAAAEAHAQRARRTTKSLRSHFGEGRSGRLHELLGCSSHVTVALARLQLTWKQL